MDNRDWKVLLESLKERSQGNKKNLQALAEAISMLDEDTRIKLREYWEYALSKKKRD